MIEMNNGPLDSLNGLFDPLFSNVPDGWGFAIALLYSASAVSALACAYKGKYGFALLAVVVPAVGFPLCCVGAIRLAKPRSFYARGMYDQKLMAVAIERHEPKVDLDKYPEPKVRRGIEHSVGDSSPT